MKHKLDLQQAPFHLEYQRESHIQSLEPFPRALPPFTKKEGNGMMDLTQSSKDKGSKTIIATNRMAKHINFFLPDFNTTSFLQKGPTTLGSAMKTDRPYEKEEIGLLLCHCLQPKYPDGFICHHC